MKRELLIFGSDGALGNGVTQVFLKKDYDKIYLFDFNHKQISSPNVSQIKIKDLSEEENVENIFSQFKPSTQTVYFLFSTIGGFTGGKKTWETSTEEFDKMMSLNLKTNFLIAKHFSLLVKNSHSGSICLTAAHTGLSAESGKNVYGTSKAAIVHFIKTLSEEGKEINLSANAIAPFIIDTPANREWMKDADFGKWIKPVEIGEFIHSVFQNYNFLSGNIFILKHRFNS